MVEVAGVAFVGIAFLHLVTAQFWVSSGALSRVSPPWREDGIERQRDFWSFQASFALPLGLLGLVLASDAHLDDVLTGGLGVVLALWFLQRAVRVPRGAFWLGIPPSVLLIAAALT